MEARIDLVPRRKCGSELLCASALRGLLSFEKDLVYVQRLLAAAGGPGDSLDTVDEVVDETLILADPFDGNLVAVLLAVPGHCLRFGNHALWGVNDEIISREPQRSVATIDGRVVSQERSSIQGTHQGLLPAAPFD